MPRKGRRVRGGETYNPETVTTTGTKQRKGIKRARPQRVRQTGFSPVATHIPGPRRLIRQNGRTPPFAVGGSSVYFPTYVPAPMMPLWHAAHQPPTGAFAFGAPSNRAALMN